MPQTIIYAQRQHLEVRREAISDVLHQCLVDVFGLPKDKRFQRFIALDADDFVYPNDRSENYTIIEIHLFTGRTTDTKKSLIRRIFQQFDEELGIANNDVEITLFESEKANWGIRGVCGDELELSYTVEK